MLTLIAALLFSPAPLVPGKIYDLPKPGGFDVISFDSKYHRVLACHSRAKTLAVLDVDSGKVDEIDTGAINGVVVSDKLSRIYVAGPDQKMVVLDRATLKVLQTVDLSGPADVMAFDSKRGQVYVCHDDGTEDWVFDAATLKPLGSVVIEEAPEFVEYDSKTDRVYQNIKSSDHLQVIDPKTRTVVATWPTAPMTSPHGLALDKKNGRAYSAGRNGMLVTIDLATGKVLATTHIAAGTDQIAFDTKRTRLYCPGSGKLTILDVGGREPKLLGEIDVPRGTHTLTVDSKTGDVWIAYGDATSAHLAQFKAS
jgi:DNA-binding beta-propeller fold protein YncE